jgi:hypothetical protein
MVIASNEVENVLNRIFLVGIAYNGQIPPLYTKAQTAILNLDKTVANVYASSVANAPYAWKRDNVLVLVVGKLMFSYFRKTNKNGDIIIVVDEVAENGQIVTEREKKIKAIIRETIEQYLKQNLVLN